jgi:hypothetical protein
VPKHDGDVTFGPPEASQHPADDGGDDDQEAPPLCPSSTLLKQLRNRIAYSPTAKRPKSVQKVMFAPGCCGVISLRSSERH